MKKISNEELYSVNGGAVRWGVYIGIGALATFVAGFVDGYVHLKKCNK